MNNENDIDSLSLIAIPIYKNRLLLLRVIQCSKVDSEQHF